MEIYSNTGERISMTESGLTIVNIPFGEGIFGKDTKLQPNETEVYAETLKQYNLTPNKLNTAMCGDDRPFKGFEAPSPETSELDEIISYSVFGGAGLATAKALSAANAKIIQDQNSFLDVYRLSVEALDRYMGYEDAGHEICGASGSVQSSTANPLNPEVVSGALGLLMNVNNTHQGYIKDMVNQTVYLSSKGFYSSWTSTAHEQFLKTNFPKNFAKLDQGEENLETNGVKLHGHTGAALYIPDKGGFAKNLATKETGKRFFTSTNEFIENVSEALGNTTEERSRIRLAFYNDALNVAKVLFAKGMPLISDMKPSNH